jgi:Putative Actinobacterial Holin-X, holin superfamily III
MTFVASSRLQRNRVAKEKSSTGGVLDSVVPLIDKMRSVRPGAAKESATRSALGTKELVQLSIGYVKQETKEPLSGIARYLQYGIIAAVFITFGLVLLLLGLLRGLQTAFAYERVKAASDGKLVTDNGTFSGGWSWVPYLLSVVGCLVVLGVIFLALRRATRPTTRTGGSR